MVCNTPEARIYSAELGLRSCVDDTFSSDGHRDVLGVAERTTPERCTDCTRYLCFPTSAQHALVLSLFWITESGCRTYRNCFPLVGYPCDDGRFCQNYPLNHLAFS